MLREVYANSGVDPATVRYVEAHGTGTAVGDPCEAESIGRFFAPYRSDDEPLFIGSCKTNVGHLEPASGVASLCKVLLMFQHRQIPPNVHFRQPNPRIPFREYNLRVPTALEPWPDDGPGIVSINSFGFGGANAHVILGEYRPADVPHAHNRNGHASPATVLRSIDQHGAMNGQPKDAGHSDATPGSKLEREWPLIVSARNEDSLKALARSWAELAAGPEGAELADLAFTAANRCTHYPHRLALVAANREELREQLSGYLAGETRPFLHTGETQEAAPVAFVFCGQGPQWAQMGRELLASEPVFADSMRAINELLHGVVGWSLLDELAGDDCESRMQLTSHAQPALFAIQVSLARLWQSWGVEPTAVLGHSVGEIAAAHVAGVVSLEDAVRIIGHRGACLQTLAEPGRMIAAEMTADEAGKLIQQFAPAVCIAAINGPRMITLAGDSAAFPTLEEQLTARSVWFKPLQVRHTFHSPLVEGAKMPFMERIGEIPRRTPGCDMISTVTAELVGRDGLPAAYWWDNIRQPVRFADAVRQLQNRGISTFLEIGPHPVLAASLRQCRRPQDPRATILPSLIREKPERPTMLAALGGLFTRGVPIDWRTFWPRGGQVVDLPPHPWSHERFWHETPDSLSHRLRPHHHPLLGHEVAGAQRCWENTLDLKVQQWVQDHRVAGRTLVPAAAFVEMLIEASGQLLSSDSIALDEIFIQRGLFLSPDVAPALQTIADASNAMLAIYSRTSEAEQSWVQHVQATCRKLPPKHAPERLDFDAWSAAERGSVDEFYEDYATVGLNFGPTFRNVRELYRGNAAVLGRVELSDDLKHEAERYRVHPTLLDGCFQTILEAMTREERCTDHIFLPERIARVQFYRSPGVSAWSEVQISIATATRLTGSMRVYTADGELALSVLDFDCRAVALNKSREQRDVGEWLYQQRWREMPLPGADLACLPVTSIVPLKESVTAARLMAERAWHDESPTQHRTAFEQADQLAVGHFVAALQQLGISLAAGSRIDPNAFVAAGKLSVADVPLLERWLSRLVQRGAAVRNATAWELVSDLSRPDEGSLWQRMLAEFPQFYPWLRLIEICGRELPARLSHAAEPSAPLQTDEALQLLDQIYRDDPRSRSANTFLQQFCREHVAQLPADRPVRILEIAAGLGSATAFILPALPRERVEYWLTERSSASLVRAEDKFRQHAFVQYHLLDVDHDLESQRIPRQAFDIVVASHTGREEHELRRFLNCCSELLTAGGVLAVRELMGAGAVHDFLSDSALQSQDGNGRRAADWLSFMSEAGFVEPQVGAGDPEIDTFATVLVARQPERAAGAPAPRVAFDQDPTEHSWLIFADRAGVGRRLAEKLRASGHRCRSRQCGRGRPRRRRRTRDVQIGCDDGSPLCVPSSLRTFNGCGRYFADGLSHRTALLAEKGAA